jgi:hypothetical protein
MAKAKFFARVWVWDTGDPSQIEVWSNDLDPMEPMKISAAEWVHNHLAECYSDEDLRQLIGLPATGNFQVVFSGYIDGTTVGWEIQEWDEWVEDITILAQAEVPESYLKMIEEHEEQLARETAQLLREDEGDV